MLLQLLPSELAFPLSLCAVCTPPFLIHCARFRLTLSAHGPVLLHLLLCEVAFRLRLLALITLPFLFSYARFRLAADMRLRS